jgi:hypothetical protein
MLHEIWKGLSLIFIGVLIVFSGCLGGPQNTTLYNTEVEIKEQKVATFPIDIQRGYVLHIKVELIQGNVADFVFIEEKELSNYLDMNAQYSIIDRWSTLNASGLDTQIYIDTGGSYIFMVDNTQRPANGAGPHGTIKAKVLITL